MNWRHTPLKRLSPLFQPAAENDGVAIAFDAGDWLYIADDTGRVRRRLVEEAAYDPRFTPDGKHLFFRRITGTVDVFAKYELFVVPSDLSAPPRALPLLRTLTVGPGVPPGPPLAGCERVADCHRRSGIAPAPERA